MSKLANESMLNLIFRLSNESIDFLKEPDPPIIKTKGISIIDWNRSDSNAINQYLNRLIKLQLSKYFKMKNEKKIKEQNKIKNSSTNRSRLSLAEYETDDEALISIFDNFGTFNQTIQLIDFDSDLEEYRMKFCTLIERLVEHDNQLFYITLRNYFDKQFNLIKNRLLVIVYIGDSHIKKFLNFIGQKKEFYFHLIIVTYSYGNFGNNLPNILDRHFTESKHPDYLKINHSSTDLNCLEIKNYDKKISKNVVHLVKI